MFFMKWKSSDWSTNAVLGVALILAGVAIFAWPHVALMIVAGTLGLNLILGGGMLLASSLQQRELLQAPVRHPEQPRLRRVVHGDWGEPEAPRWRGRVMRF